MISFSILFFIAVAFTKPADPTGPVVVKTPAESVNKTVLLQLVNGVRKRGCQCGDTWYPAAPPVTWNDLLEKAAFRHSSDMSQKKYFSHTSPDGTGAGKRIAETGYRWMYYGENIAMGYANEREVITGWLNSPGHCKNIMNKNYKEMGVAKVNGYWTQEFGSK